MVALRVLLVMNRLDLQKRKATDLLIGSLCGY